MKDEIKINVAHMAHGTKSMDDRKVLKMKQSFLKFRPQTSPGTHRRSVPKPNVMTSNMYTRDVSIPYLLKGNGKTVHTPIKCLDAYSQKNINVERKKTVSIDPGVGVSLPGLVSQTSELLDIKTRPDKCDTKLVRVQSAPKKLAYLTKKGRVSFREHVKPRPATVVPCTSRNNNAMNKHAYRRSEYTRVPLLNTTAKYFKFEVSSKSNAQSVRPANTGNCERVKRINAKSKKEECQLKYNSVIINDKVVHEYNSNGNWLPVLRGHTGESLEETEQTNAPPTLDNPSAPENPVTAEEHLKQSKNIDNKSVLIKTVADIKGESVNVTNVSDSDLIINSESDKHACTHSDIAVHDNSLKRKLLQHFKVKLNWDRKRKSIKMRNKLHGNQGGINHEDNAAKRKVNGLFLTAINSVRSVVRLLTSMVDLSADMMPRSATEEQWHAVHTSKGARGMAFNKTVFAKKKDVSKVPYWTRVILDKSPEDRSDDELRKMHALLRGLKSFDRFTEKIQLSMCRSFTYHSVVSGRIILRQGHVGINFYFLFTGSVFVNLYDTDAHGNQFAKTEVILRRGDSFGELALLQDIKRTATVSCREDCELLVVDKDTFAKVCPKIFEKELDEKIGFLSRLNLFNTKLWNQELLKKMCFEAQIQEYKTNKVIVSDTLTNDWIYICMEGKCQVIRRLNLTEEIEWRKLQQIQINKQNSYNNHDTGNDVINLNEIIGTRRHESNGESDKRSAISNMEEGRQRLLDSMGLEYRQTRRMSLDDMQSLLELQRQYRGNARSESRVSVKSSAVEGPLTLTALLTQEVQEDDSILYLNIKTLVQNEIFDISNILSNDESDTNGSYILVSSGARLMRIRRKSFFRYAIPEATQHAKTVAEKERYPPDETLLQRFRAYLQWEVYKYTVLDRTLSCKQQAKQSSQLRLDTKPTTNSTLSRSFDNNKHVLQKLENVLDVETDRKYNVRHWKKVQRLSENVNKGKQTKLNDDTGKYNTLASVERSLGSSEYVGKGYAMAMDPKLIVDFQDRRRRSSVATGLLRRESLYNDWFEQRRMSVPHANKEFTTIVEVDELFIPSAINETSITD